MPLKGDKEGKKLTIDITPQCRNLYASVLTIKEITFLETPSFSTNDEAIDELFALSFLFLLFPPLVLL